MLIKEFLGSAVIVVWATICMYALIGLLSGLKWIDQPEWYDQTVASKPLWVLASAFFICLAHVFFFASFLEHVFHL